MPSTFARRSTHLDSRPMFLLGILIVAATAMACPTVARAGPLVQVDEGSAADLYYKLLHPGFGGSTLALKGTYDLSGPLGSVAVRRVVSEVSGADPSAVDVAAMSAADFAALGLDPAVASAVRLGYLDAGDRDLRGENLMTLEDGIAHSTDRATVINGALLEKSDLSFPHVSSPGVQFDENRSLIRAPAPGAAASRRRCRADGRGTADNRSR